VSRENNVSVEAGSIEQYTLSVIEKMLLRCGGKRLVQAMKFADTNRGEYRGF
jgi:hypothetical protein